MTDNRTTELLHKLLDERGVEWTDGDSAYTTEWTNASGQKCSAMYWKPTFTVLISGCTPEQAIAATLGTEINGETSDGYHTFNELYHHRAVLFSVIVRDHRELAWKARKHHDGTMYDGMFIVGIETPKGQATYHYDLDPYWEMFDCAEREYAPEWDGHTPDDAIARIAELGSDTKPCYAADENYKRCKYSVNRGWCDDAPFIVWDDTGHLFITMGGLKTWDVTDDVKKWFAELGNGTLTAEQVWRAVDPRSVCVPEKGDKEWQAIADELNAELGSGTCELEQLSASESERRRSDD